jgi:rubrerythrin
MKNCKSKALEAMKKDEEKGIKEYKQDIKKSKGKEKDTYKKILPDEIKHLKELKQI